MPALLPLLPALLPLLPAVLPLLFLGGAALSRTRCRWTIARATSGLALAAALAAAAVAAAAGHGGPTALPLASLVMALLITFMAFIIVRYSANHLSGEPGAARYLTTLQGVLAAVCAVVLTDHLLVLLGAWTAISLGLHQLLLFYPERPRAALAAHKKFLFARLAELLLAGAVVLLYLEHGTWRISEIVAAVAGTRLTAGEQLAAVLLAAAALIKCAQLPMHGWLIQVVEAPTPVSALLHAGIVNLGGYLLILFAPLLVQATAAQWLLLVVAGLTTLIAALVMTTRISIKVKLAWSTCAQMGLMLVECALGLFELALLHLTAHACYKAWGFLGAGGTVSRYLTSRLAAPAVPTPLAWLGAAAVALPMALLSGYLMAPHGPLSPWLLMAGALTVVLAERSSRQHTASLADAAAIAVLLLAAYVLQKLGAGLLVPGTPTSAGWPADAWVALIAATLTVTYIVLRLRPRGFPTHRLSTWLFAGLYLDEWVTRTTLRLWPVSLPAGAADRRFRLLPQE